MRKGSCPGAGNQRIEACSYMRDIGRGVRFAAPRREAGCFHLLDNREEFADLNG